jgi:hypothetical protein
MNQGEDAFGFDMNRRGNFFIKIILEGDEAEEIAVLRR